MPNLPLDWPEWSELVEGISMNEITVVGVGKHFPHLLPSINKHFRQKKHIFKKIVVFFFPRLLDYPPGIAKHPEVQEYWCSGDRTPQSNLLSIVVRPWWATFWTTKKGELATTKTPVRDLRIRSNLRRSLGGGKYKQLSKHVNSPLP